MLAAEELLEEGAGLESLVNFLVPVAIHEPKTFVTLLSRIVPLEEKEAARASACPSSCETRFQLS